MGYLYGVVILILLFAVLHYFTGLNNGQKIIIFITIVAIISFAYLYNSNTKKQQQKILTNVQAFNIGKTLTCTGRDVNLTNYTLSIGTYTFLGKKHTLYYGNMISVSSCK